MSIESRNHPFCVVVGAKLRWLVKCTLTTISYTFASYFFTEFVLVPSARYHVHSKVNSVHAPKQKPIGSCMIDVDSRSGSKYP